MCVGKKQKENRPSLTRRRYSDKHRACVVASIFPDSFSGSCGLLCGLTCGWVSLRARSDAYSDPRPGLWSDLWSANVVCLSSTRDGTSRSGRARDTRVAWAGPHRPAAVCPGPLFTREALAAPVSYDFYYAENRHINFRSFEKCGPVIRGCVCPDARWHRAREVQR